MQRTLGNTLFLTSENMKFFPLFLLQQSLEKQCQVCTVSCQIYTTMCVYTCVRVCTVPRKIRKSKKEEENKGNCGGESMPNAFLFLTVSTSFWSRTNKLPPPNTFIYNLVLKQQSGKSISRTLSVLRRECLCTSPSQSRKIFIRCI